ncbi:NmrA/HSCARG family protein [Kribbella sp. CA-294648]|uniref:NmrA/HSCARG family protein n=1 Tax=Kribbella sp. CA-294648 TaxID=3239948 RepID=UPI003D9239C0
MERNGLIAVLGATGRQGGAVARHLLADGWRVRGLSRKPDSPAGDALRASGVEVAGCDMAEPDSLLRVFEGAYGVYSVQNPMIAGHDGEVRQGKNVADAAKATGVQHVVYGSAGPGLRGTGVDSWESKQIIADYLRELGVPLTVLRPTAFMELMTDKDFYPPVAVWRLMPKLAGDQTPVPWLTVDDLGAIAARAFATRPNSSARNSHSPRSSARSPNSARSGPQQQADHPAASRCRSGSSNASPAKT